MDVEGVSVHQERMRVGEKPTQGGPTSMRPVPIVMLHKHPQRSLHVALARDQHPVQTLGTGGPYEPFGNTVRRRRTNRRTKNLQAIAAKHVVKRGREFLVVIPD